MGILLPPFHVGGGRLDQKPHAVDRQGRQEGLRGILQGEFDRVGVQWLDGLDDLEEGTGEGPHLLLHDMLEVPGHGGGVEVGAVVEFHPLTQLKHIYFAAVLGLPGLGQLWDVVEVLIDGHQAVEEIAHHVPDLQAWRPVRVKARHVRLLGDA
jgi:hypothetical protein